MLTLTEELLLLAIHDEKGTIIFASTGSIPYGLGATLLLDLAEKKAIELIDNQINLIEKPINTPNFLNLAFEILNLRSQSMSFKDAILEVIDCICSFNLAAFSAISLLACAFLSALSNCTLYNPFKASI